MELKRQDVNAEIQAAMAEIHQAAQPDQMGTVAKADAALEAKKQAAAEAETLTQLDAMRVQITNIRQQYVRVLMVPSKPDEKIATVYRTSLGYSVKLKSEEDIDSYVADIKDTLMEMLDGNDGIHII